MFEVITFDVSITGGNRRSRLTFDVRRSTFNYIFLNSEETRSTSLTVCQTALLRIVVYDSAFGSDRLVMAPAQTSTAGKKRSPAKNGTSGAQTRKLGPLSSVNGSV
jgi:hypothetical protein